jgi:hypothetical protein
LTQIYGVSHINGDARSTTDREPAPAACQHGETGLDKRRNDVGPDEPRSAEEQKWRRVRSIHCSMCKASKDLAKTLYNSIDSS